MHILIFRTSCSSLDPSSYNCQEIGLAKALLKSGVSVSVVLAGQDKTNYIDETGVHVYTLPYKALNQAYGIMIGYKELLQELKPDVIQVHEIGLYMSFKVSQWAKQNGIPTILIQGPYELSKRPVIHQLHSLFNLTYGKRIVSNAAAVGVKTKFAQEFLKEYTSKPVSITPVGLDTTPFISSGDIDWSQKIDSSKRNLLYIGRLEPRRNILFMLDVLNALSDNYHLLLVGSGNSDYVEEIKNRIANLNLQSKVSLLGRFEQNNLPELYKLADLFLLPSSYEIYGMVILESMYFSLPVVSTRTAGADLIIRSDNGLILDNLDSTLWARSIQEIIENQTAMKVMKSNAGNTIRDEYLWSKTASKFIELYNKAINESTTSK